MKTYLIYSGGVHALLFFVFHAFFWRLFRWKTDLEKLHFSNRAILQIANLRLMHVFLLLAVLCFYLPEELLNTRLGHFILAGFSLFWFGRMIEQFIFLRVNDIRIHLLTFMFLLGALLFALPLVLP